MQKITFLILILSCTVINAQIKGKVTDKNNNPLPYVSIFIQNTLVGTTTNDNGFYELPVAKKGEYTVNFQFLGYKTIKKKISVSQLPFTLNVKMSEKQELLNEVSIQTKENPANAIIRKAIANKNKNTQKSGTYTADFYSRGLIKIKNAPKKRLGFEIGDLGGGLDSTRSGIIYLSETVSKITAQKKPKNFKEFIVASKVSGDNNGVSFNQAAEVNFNLYNNLVPLANNDLFSPISGYAFSYYRFKLVGSFYDENNRLVNKIQLLPKRENDRVFGGYIYIVEDDWAIYGAELTATGAQINNPAIDILHINQNYTYDAQSKVWALMLQTIDFKIGILGFNMNGRFSASYSNYNFSPTITENTFTKEILSFDENATDKDSSYWRELRKVPLTSEEQNDYVKKDSISSYRNSKKYLDSVDTKRNKFKILSPILGYTFRNSHEKWNVSYTGILGDLNFNTVQGFNTSAGLNYTKRLNDKGNAYTIGASANYGLADKRLRPSVFFNKSWNNFSKPYLSFEAGVSVQQFDDRNPISTLYNSLYSLFAKENYAKFFEKSFAKISYSRELKPGIRVYSNFEYARRNPLFNNTDYSFFNRDGEYQTNNPFDNNDSSASFNKHYVFTGQIAAQINFGSKYITYPDSRFTVTSRKFPTLTLGYRKTFGSGMPSLHSDFIFSRLQQQVSFGNFGQLNYNVRAGMFFNTDNLSFVDYYHPLANEIGLANFDRLSGFNIMPYYEFSTNDQYAEAHIQHNFKGFLLSKIPLVNKLNFHTVVGFKGFYSNKKPYSEYTLGLTNIGWGKWRFLRFDYVKSFHNNNTHDQFLLGITIFNN